MTNQPIWVIAALLALVTPATLLAEPADPADAADAAEHATPAATRSIEERLEALEAKAEVTIDEIDSLRKIFAVPEEQELTSYSGLGPAASKVYQRDRGLSIGGYGEVRFRGQVADDDNSQDVFDALRMVLYAGYKFNDWIVFNSELEFEHAGTGGGGSVSTEFMTLDFLFADSFNARAGLVLVPMGVVNELHEPNFFFGAARPEVERRIIPSTWRENGAGFYGSIAERVDYRIYAVNGLDASGFSDNGLRGGRQKGSEALADHWAVVARVDAELFPGVDIGGSIYHGKSGQNATNTRGVTLTATPTVTTTTTFAVPDTRTTIWELHGRVRYAGATVQGLFAQSILGDTAALSLATGDTVARKMQGGYVEVAYDLMPLIDADSEMTIEPFYRYERLDTQHSVSAGSIAALAPEGISGRNPSRDRTLHVVGLQYKPHPQVVIKLDYRNINSAGTDLPDEVQAGIGFVF